MDGVECLIGGSTFGVLRDVLRRSDDCCDESTAQNVSSAGKGKV